MAEYFEVLELLELLARLIVPPNNSSSKITGRRIPRKFAGTLFLAFTAERYRARFRTDMFSL